MTEKPQVRLPLLNRPGYSRFGSLLTISPLIPLGVAVIVGVIVQIKTSREKALNLLIQDSSRNSDESK